MEDTEKNSLASDQALKEKLDNEIAPVCWHDLQLVFAKGITILVAPELNLKEVAFEISKNNTGLIERWMDEGKLSHVRDDQALKWFNANSEVLTAIVKPWVLLQELD